MRLLNEERTERLLDRDGRRIECIVRHRGIDVRSDSGMGFVIEQQSPVAVVVDDGRQLTRMPIEPTSMARRLAWLAPPLMALMVRRAVKARRR